MAGNLFYKGFNVEIRKIEGNGTLIPVFNVFYSGKIYHESANGNQRYDFVQGALTNCSNILTARKDAENAIDSCLMSFC